MADAQCWPGDKTRDHGYPIIERKPSGFPGGEYIIADRGEHREFHRYAVWHMYPEGHCEGGQYLSTLRDAKICFNGSKG